MVGSGDHDYVAWKGVDLKKERANYAFDFSRLVNITSFLANDVKFIKK